MTAGAFLPRNDGGAAVEFAITSPVFFLLLLGVLQAGLWLFTYFSLQRAVNAAARCAVIQTSTCGSAANTQSYASSTTVGLSVPTSAFTVTNPATCTVGAATVNAAKVAASYTVPTFTAGLGLPSLTVNVSACYPI